LFCAKLVIGGAAESGKALTSKMNKMHQFAHCIFIFVKPFILTSFFYGSTLNPQIEASLGQEAAW
jgi:hypothetical protein